jgi:hypothetical protein
MLDSILPLSLIFVGSLSPGVGKGLQRVARSIRSKLRDVPEDNLKLFRYAQLSLYHQELLEFPPAILKSAFERPATTWPR